VIERLLAVAFAQARAIEPSEVDVQRVLARLGARPRRSVRRVVALSLAFVLLAVSVAFAVPQSRERILDGLGSLGDFLSGGSAPGPSVPEDEPSGRLNFFDLAAPGERTVLVQLGRERLVTFRDATTGDACLGLGTHVAECGKPDHWGRRFETPALGTLTTTQTDQKGKVALWGVAAEAVDAVSISYADGGSVAGRIGNGGYIVVADGARSPQTLLGRDRDGAVIAQVDVSELQWRFCFVDPVTGAKDGPC
jgi:hypothetical protein